MTLILYIGDARQQIQNLNSKVDCWYLDGFSPSKNPELWETDLLKQVYQRTRYGGTFSTFTSAGWDFINTWDLTCESISYPQLIWEITPADLLCPHGVDFFDYCFLANRYGQTDCHLSNDCDLTDFDLSGTVDIIDVNIFTNYWLFGK